VPGHGADRLPTHLGKLIPAAISLSLLIITGCTGEEGPSCRVAENDDGTAAITCGTDTVTIVTRSIGETRCADGSSLDICEVDIGFGASEDYGEDRSLQEVGECEIPLGDVRLSIKAVGDRNYTSWQGQRGRLFCWSLENGL
jgi:hypothetical protein